MNYAYLGARKTRIGDAQLPTVYRRLDRSNAARLPAARAYVGHGLLRHYEFDSLREHQRFTVFHLLLSHRMQETQ
jgi:hypothetical protein